MKLCECGCGNPAPIAKKTVARLGHVKGMPIRFIYHHQTSPIDITKHARWKGGRALHDSGYQLVRCPGHPRANKGGYVLEHILVAEKAIGRYLPISAQVHHVNEVRSCNENGNLVICQDLAYHKLIHQRTEAFRATGDPRMRRCSFCQKWGLDLRETSGSAHHLACRAIYRKSKIMKGVANGN